MNSAEAKGILKYIKSNLSDNDKLTKGLKEVKVRIIKEKKNCHVFRKLGLTSILIKCLKNSDECVLNWTLSILTSCSSEKEFQKEVHETGILDLFNIFKTSKCRAVQHRVCRVIGQQSSYDPSCSVFHNLKAAGLVVSFIKELEIDEEKGSAIRTLRCLTDTQTRQSMVLKENGLYHICQIGLFTTCQKLRDETLKTILHFNKWPNTTYFKQLMKGTDNLLLLTKLYELDEDEVKKQVLDIFLTVFSHHSSCSNIQEYNTNCKTLDYLCMAKLPFMIVSELQTKQDQAQWRLDESKLILVLCKFCELNNQWRKFSFNVLPTYHERTWMQLTDCRGIALLISLLSSKRNNLNLLQALFRGLLGLEYLHSNRIKVLYYCLEAKLLPLLAEIFDDALKETCDNVEKDFESENCHHFSVEIETSKASFCKETSTEILNLIEFTTPKSTSENNDFRREIALSNPSGVTPSPKPLPTVSYKQMNKIKFRTGKRTFQADSRSRKRHLSLPEDPSEIREICPSVASEESVQDASEGKAENVVQRKAQKTLDKQRQMWMNILEYIIRLLYQVVSIKEDITSICRQFLLKLYHYISKACIVHPSVLKLLSAIAKNSSSIQYVLDILFIPKLAVDLVNETFLDDCSQCALINKGVNAFLVKLRLFFNHHHQYGQCEVANRLNPSKPDHVKHSCLVAFTHIIKCPKLLHSFLLDHRGLESLLHVFSPPLDAEPQITKLHLYGIASLCGIAFNLKSEYCRRYNNSCLFCDVNHKALTGHVDLEKKEKRKQLLILTSSNHEVNNKGSSKCNLEEEEEKNCSFKSGDRLIFANREKLSMKNEVLKVMLQGSFSESMKNCVQIRDVNALSMEMVIHFIYGCTCNVFSCQDPNVYSELLFVAEMYFIPELQILAMHHLSDLLDPDHIFSFIECRTEILGKNLLQHLLCSLMSQPTSVLSKEKWMNQFLTSSLKDVFIDNTSVGLTQLLEVTSSICNCDAYRNYM